MQHFAGIQGIVSILEYNHPNIRINAQITLTLKDPSTANFNALRHYVENNVPYVESTEWINRYWILYHYRNLP